jgi:hypothetical protein
MNRNYYQKLSTTTVYLGKMSIINKERIEVEVVSLQRNKRDPILTISAGPASFGYH